MKAVIALQNTGLKFTSAAGKDNADNIDNIPIKNKLKAEFVKEFKI